MRWSTLLSTLALLSTSAMAAPAHHRWSKGPAYGFAKAAASKTSSKTSTPAASSAPAAAKSSKASATSLSIANKAAATSSAAPASYTAPATSSSGLATWLWESDIISDSAEVADFLSFSKSHGIKRVYAGINADIHHDVWQSFISQCTTAGIAVDALMGNSDWIKGSGVPTLDQQLKWIDYHQGNATASSQKLSGIHFDVEPWALDDFSSNSKEYISSYETIVGTITSFGKSHGLTVAADLPFWANTLKASNGQSLDAWALSKLDSATFMTYRNTAAEVLSLASTVLNAGKAAGKPVWLAVETKQATEATLISYVVKTLSNLTSDLKTILSGAAQKGPCAGIAVHDYHGWRDLDG